ncbi:MAG TPA: HD domain-containing protein [Longimicrobiaceae bacterium]|nr:HD domain-containing protein [Longimicrobiaceae bacterium]
MKRLFPRTRLPEPRVPHPLMPRAEDTQIDLAAALTFALYAIEPRLHVGAHCARVAARLAWLAEVEGFGESELRALVRAAELHEVGMVAVPVELLENPDPLTPAELARIRAQAWIGAEIVRKTEGDLTAWLIQHQYTDYEVLRARFPVESTELLLAGLFRVADVTDALTEPRPYQRRLPEHRRLDVLFSGIGTRFHPEAVRALVEAGPPPG